MISIAAIDARSFRGRAEDHPAGAVIPPHRHRGAQLLFASSGVLRVEAARSHWVVPPNRAVWLPPGETHTVRMGGAVTMRTLYLAREITLKVPRWAECHVIAVSALLRALILDLVEGGHGPARRRAVMALLLDELHHADHLPLQLPMPGEPRLRRLCLALAARPQDDRDFESLATESGASARTLARLFRRETGLSFRIWRQQVRLIAALERLSAGESVGAVAGSLGYRSASAFTAMFRRALGRPPQDFLRDRGTVRG
jgi:AraC-like DNA-binding protein